MQSAFVSRSEDSTRSMLVCPSDEVYEDKKRLVIAPATTVGRWGWHRVPAAANDSILRVVELYRGDASENKVNLSIGEYCDATGRATELRCITEARRRISSRAPDHSYLPLCGLKALIQRTETLLLGDCDTSVASLQSLSGSGALRLALELCHKRMDANIVYVSAPTWPNHCAIAQEVGMEVRRYAYYDATTKSIDMQGMLATLEAAPMGAVVILHACGHNPTGMDIDTAGWQAVEDVVRRRTLIPVFDVAYTGLLSGSIGTDAMAVRQFVDAGVPTLAAFSFSKNLGLYNARVGTLHVVLPGHSAAAVAAVLSQLIWLARATYSTPPARGARLAAEVLFDEALSAQWKMELGEMSTRSKEMRNRLQAALESADAGMNWDFVSRGKGMFALFDLDERQVALLREVHHVYVAAEGRVNVCGLTEASIWTVARAIAAVLR